MLVIVDSSLAVEQRLPPPSCTLPAEMIDSSITSDTAADLSLNHDSHLGPLLDSIDIRFDEESSSVRVLASTHVEHSQRPKAKHL